MKLWQMVHKTNNGQHVQNFLSYEKVASALNNLIHDKKEFLANFGQDELITYIELNNGESYEFYCINEHLNEKFNRIVPFNPRQKITKARLNSLRREYGFDC